MKKIIYIVSFLITSGCATYNETKNSEPPPLPEVKAQVMASQANADLLPDSSQRKKRQSSHARASIAKSSVPMKHSQRMLKRK